jgi:hypothetical protein
MMEVVLPNREGILLGGIDDGERERATTDEVFTDIGERLSPTQLATTLCQPGLQSQNIAGHYGPPETNVVHSGEENDLTSGLRRREGGYRSRLREGLQLKNTGEDRVARKMAAEHVQGLQDVFFGDRVLARDQFHHAVEQEKRFPVRDDRFNLSSV